MEYNPLQQFIVDLLNSYDDAYYILYPELLTEWEGKLKELIKNEQ